MHDPIATAVACAIALTLGPWLASIGEALGVYLANLIKGDDEW